MGRVPTSAVADGYSGIPRVRFKGPNRIATAEHGVPTTDHNWFVKGILAELEDAQPRAEYEVLLRHLDSV